MKKKEEIFKDIVGYSETKKTLERIIDVLNNQEKYKNIGITIPKGLFLYGEPGLGKTTFANGILNNVKNRKQYVIRKTKSDGDFINCMSEIFKKAKENQPSIILLDDIDKFAEDDKNINNEEFVAVQSLIDGIKNDDVFIIATANDKQVLPKSLLRAGRFDIKIQIQNPNEKDSYEIISHYLKNKPLNKDVNIKNISYILECSSCADLEKVCNQAGIYAAFKNKKSIGMEELLRASLEAIYDTNIESFIEDDKYALQTAYHEAGHALVGEILEPGNVSFITIAKNNSNVRGITKYHNNEYYWDDIKFMNNRLITLLAGKAAIDIVYNKCDVGSNSDLSRAYQLASRFINNYCMLDFNSWFKNDYEQSEKVKENKDNNINKLMTDSYNQAKEILLSNRNKLDDLARKLTDKKILFESEIRNIIS